MVCHLLPGSFCFLLISFIELIASANGADREKRFALEQLHTIIASKRKHNWTKIDETLMNKHLELCVDLKDHRTAKDGLHQYRNLVQQVCLLS
jgi:hypothetical protein